MLTPPEFDAIYDAWKSEREDNDRGKWERCRWICYYTLKPYAKKGLKPEDVLKFGWDESHGTGGSKKMTESELEADKKEFERLLELWKDE